MSWFQKALLASDRARAAERPKAFVLSKTWEFATGFTFVWVVAAVVIPGWSADMTFPHLLFVAVVGGFLNGLMLLVIARRAPSVGGNATGTSIT